MGRIAQYLRETRAELRHVAWPTQTQTIVYTVLVAAISIFVALYLGLFDVIFTAGLAKLVDTTPSVGSVQTTQVPAASTSNATTTNQ